MTQGARRLFAAYAIAVAIGVGAPVFVLRLARSSAAAADPLLPVIAIVVALGIVAALVTRLVPRHWLALALVVSVPLGILGIAMFAALANIGEFFWIWLGVGLGALGAALLGAYVVARRG